MKPGRLTKQNRTFVKMMSLPAFAFAALSHPSLIGQAPMAVVLRNWQGCNILTDMQTLVVRIPDEVAADIEAEARRLNSTKSDVARKRLVAGRARNDAHGFDMIRDLVGTDT